ncbi:MAG: hypothetical protein C4533_05430 [Candidatus Omnitrophota bacterium]|jgi:hypothetical protein|nr:MAG: hypothetical protein C4533_05430 [Candidatus Omnitrophota bacterium]
MIRFRIPKFLISSFISGLCIVNFAFATPSTHIWSPSTDIQPYKKIHITADTYTPTTGKGTNADNYDQHTYVQQVYGLTFSLLSDKQDDNALGRIWQPLGKVMAETGFDYKKGFGSFYDSTPWYFHFKFGIPEGAYFKDMPAFAIGGYDLGTKTNRTNYNIWYFKGAKSFNLGGLDLGRFSAGYFNGNKKLLLDKNGKRDNDGIMLAWERTMHEISDKLWLCVDYQGTQSSYGALNFGFAWKFSNNVSAIIGYDIYNNHNSTDTVTFQLDIDF